MVKITGARIKKGQVETHRALYWIAVLVLRERNVQLPQQKSLTEQAWLMRRDERTIEIDHWVPHDLRRTVRTVLSRLGCPSEVAETALGYTHSGI